MQEFKLWFKPQRNVKTYLPKVPNHTAFIQITVSDLWKTDQFLRCTVSAKFLMCKHANSLLGFDFLHEISGCTETNIE